MWSEPHRISEKMLNSYKLETLEGQPIDGEFHARRLRRFIPREGTELAAQQKEVEAREKENVRVDDLEPDERELNESNGELKLEPGVREDSQSSNDSA